MDFPDDVRLVFSTDKGRIETPKEPEKVPQGDGVIRIKMERKGRKGKGAMIITGLGLPAKELKPLAAQLKKKMGCGGAVKEYDIEIQGDNREKLKEHLIAMGYQVKLAGG